MLDYILNEIKIFVTTDAQNFTHVQFHQQFSHITKVFNQFLLVINEVLLKELLEDSLKD